MSKVIRNILKLNHRGGLAGQAFTSYKCHGCLEEKMHSNTAVPFVCRKCEKELKEISQLKQRLKDAEAVIDFYGDKRNREVIAANIESWLNHGGKRAREYRKKYLKEQK